MRKQRVARSWFPLVALVAVSSTTNLATGPAHAKGDKEVCLKAYDAAQRLRQDNKLRKAREQLLVCARPVCPTILRRDCTQWTTEVESSLPSVVVDVTGPDGTAAIDVKVRVDGEPFLDEIDGRARPIDPGVRVFVFELEGEDPIEKKVIIREGQKNQGVKADFSGGGTVDPGTGGSGGSGGIGEDREMHRPVPTATYVMGGIGIAALGGFTYFALKFNGQMSDLDDCKPNCAQDDVDSASTTRMISLIPLGVGVVSLGVATYLYMSRPEVPLDAQEQEPEQEPELVGMPRFDVVPMNGGAMGVVGGVF